MMRTLVPIAANACSTCALAPGADGHHRDDGADADDDAERGEERAQLVAQDGAEGDAQRLEGVHCAPARGLPRGSGDGRLGLLPHVRHDAPVLHLHDARRELGDVRLVRDQHDGDARAPEPLEDGHDVDARARVERAGGLVGQDDLGRRSTMARAMATRCCWPPESWFGWWCMRCAEAHALERLGRALAPRARRPRRRTPAAARRSRARSCAQSRLNCWKTKPEDAVAHLARARPRLMPETRLPAST